MNALVTVPVETNHSLDDIARMAKVFAASQLFGIKTMEQAAALMLVAQADGLHPATVARDYDIIQGRPAKKSEAMLRDFIRNGGSVKWHDLSDDLADATFSHPQGGEVRITWDMARAKAAQLGGKDMWKKFPRQMLRSRVVSEGIRTVCPMATGGMYVPEEVRDFAPDAEATPVRSSAQAKRDGDWQTIVDEIAACPTRADVIAWEAENVERIRTLPAKWRQCVQDELTYKMEALAADAELEASAGSYGALEHTSDEVPLPAGDDPTAWDEWRLSVATRIKRAGSADEVGLIQTLNAFGIAACARVHADTVERMASLVDAKLAKLALQEQAA